MAPFSVQDRPGGIAVVTIDLRKDASPSPLPALRAGLDALVARLADGGAPAAGFVLRLIGNGDVALVDLESVRAGRPEEELMAGARELVDRLARIDDAPVPTVAVLEGQVLGAGFEVALACRHRIVLADARVGLPALSMGLLPAAGSIGRLLRQMPLRVAIDFLARSGAADAPAALELGLVDAVADSPAMAERIAMAWFTDPGRKSGTSAFRSPRVDPTAAQSAAAIAMTALPGRRRAAIALAAVASAWATEDRDAAAAIELRRAAEIATHADTRAWLAREQESSGSTAPVPVPAGHDVRAAASHDHALAMQRIRAAGLLEAMALVGDGLPAARLERLASSIGMKPTPLSLLDELSLAPIDAAHHASEHAHHGHGQSHRHGQGHRHGHDHEHGHEHAHVHGHAHDDGHGHEHDHRHGHGHSHEHHGGHPHHHEHGQAHGHDHAHEDAHDHHDHGHGHHHGHAHRHGHGHDEPVVHPIDPSAWPAVPPAAVYVLEKMSHGFGRTGRAAGGGFYDYPPGSTPALWPGLRTFERPSLAFEDADCTDRLLFAQAVEALRGLASGRVEPGRLDEIAREAGFPLAGGVTGFVASRGRASFAARCAELALKFGDRFALPATALDKIPTDA